MCVKNLGVVVMIHGHGMVRTKELNQNLYLDTTKRMLNGFAALLNWQQPKQKVMKISRDKSGKSLQ